MMSSKYVVKRMYNNLKIVELKEIARSRGIRCLTGFRKAELIAFIEKREREVKSGDPVRYYGPGPEKEEELKK